jgi:hypothetical protein
MMILARSGATYARLAFRAGPTAEILMPVRVEWSAWPQALASEKPPLDAQVATWRGEFAANVMRVRLFQQQFTEPSSGSSPMLQAAQVPWWDDEGWPVLEEPIDHDFHPGGAS